MEAPDVLDVGQSALLIMLQIGAPVMIVALVVGLVISLFQALTQIQEMTLTFVPKMLAIFAGLIIFLPFMISTMTGFMQQIASRIANLQ